MSATIYTPGIHHITAISGSARENYRFYSEMLGLRLVKKTVNFDDPGTYHLYYGNADGTPGTIMTFFPWENMPAGRVGNGQVAAVAFAAAADSKPFWQRRLETGGIHFTETRRFGESVLGFADPHGLPLELIFAEGVARPAPWSTGSIPRQHAVRGFHSATARLHTAQKTAEMVTEVLGLEPVGSENGRTRFRGRHANSPGTVFDIVEEPNGVAGRSGVGTVHHIAFRAADDREQRHWQQKVTEFGLDVTRLIDRNYFHSIYFRDTGGVLFEMATDPPGFTIDEDLPDLGSGLMLPPQYEAMRGQLEERLPPLETDDEAAENSAMLAG